MLRNDFESIGNPGMRQWAMLRTISFCAVVVLLHACRISSQALAEVPADSFTALSEWILQNGGQVCPGDGLIFLRTEINSWGSDHQTLTHLLGICCDRLRKQSTREIVVELHLAI